MDGDPSALLRRTDQNLYIHLSRKMVYHLFWSGIAEAKELLKSLSRDQAAPHQAEMSDDINRPSQRRSQLELLRISDETFRIASRYLTDKEILGNIQKWIQEDKAGFLSKAINNIDMPLVDVINAITHYHYISGGNERTVAAHGKRTARFADPPLFFRPPRFHQHRQEPHRGAPFHDLVQKIIYPANGYGRLGGKSAGLFLAQKILTQPGSIPRSWAS